MERLEDSVAKITSVLQTIHQEVQGLTAVKDDVRALRAAQQAKVLAEGETGASASAEASQALNRLESVICAAHQHFAQIDSDGNGLLDLKELGGAMAALGVHVHVHVCDGGGRWRLWVCSQTAREGCLPPNPNPNPDPDPDPDPDP